MLAWGVILIGHESAHGILARLLKIRLKSAGVVLYGILPVGAFVDPDDKQLEGAALQKQRDVLVAGSTANFITTFISFVLLFSFIYASAPLQDQRVMISAHVNSTSLIEPAELSSFNGVPVAGVTDLIDRLSATKGGDILDLETSDGRIVTVRLGQGSSISSISSTYIECTEIACQEMGYVKGPDEPTFLSMSFMNANNAPFVFLGTRFSDPIIYSNAFKPGWGWLSSIYALLGLTFVLNFLIGSINLMPIPMFDGHRLVGLAVPNKFAMKIITYGVSLAFILNLVPWLWV